MGSDVEKRQKPILIVDDEVAIRLYHKAAMEKYFSNILQASNGLEAWEIFRQQEEVPLVVTDVEMPQMNGLELVAKIHQEKPSTQIIIVSGLTGNEVSFHSIKSNIAYLPKPVDKTFLRLAALRGYGFHQEALWYDELKQVAGEKPRSVDKILAVLDAAPWTR